MYRWFIVFCIFIGTGMAKAEDRPRAILVLDASGSMWGQIDGTAKISIAQDVIGGLLQDLPPEQVLGLTAYGHRRKGDCGDIETLIQPEGDQRAAILNAVNGIKPKGKTPLSAAVIQAAEALRYTEEAATVILISDGRETCDFDPCAVGRQLEDAGIDFTAHVIGFDVTNLNDRIQLQCLAEETGGTFRTAADASELADALLVISKPPAPPAPSMLTLRAIEGPGGPMIDDGLTWALIGDAGIIYDGSTASPALELARGGYTAMVTRTIDNASVSREFQMELDDKTLTLVLPELPPEPVKISYEAYITETNKLIKDPLVWDVYDAEGVALVSSNVVYKDSIELMPGQYRIEVLRPEDEAYATASFAVGDVRKTIKLNLPKIQKLATLNAPTTAVAGSRITVDWTGPNEKDDYISVTTIDGRNGTWDEYTYTKEGASLSLRMPATSGEYEIRYVLAKGREDLAKRRITVTPVTSTITPPAQLSAGASVAIDWTGPDYKGDYLSVVNLGEDASINYTYTREGTPLKLQMPSEPGNYEIIYTLEQDRTVLHRVPITVSGIEYSVTAPEAVKAGSTVSVDWVGPGYDGDFVTVAQVDVSGAYYEYYTYAREGSPLGLKMPLEPGTYEVRYILDQDRVIAARRTITVTEVAGAVTGPTEAVIGTTIPVSWTGPDYKGDYVTIAKLDDTPSKYESYVYTNKGDPVKLQMPSEPGSYELRYIADGKTDIILARQPITIKTVDVTLSADARVVAGQPFEVTWTGPGSAQDYITISEIGDTGYEKYKYAREGSVVTLEAPSKTGTYELRYYLDKDNKIIARHPIIVE